MESLDEILSRCMAMSEIRHVAGMATESEDLRERLLEYSASEHRRVAVNSLWSLTHLPPGCRDWMQKKQNHLIDMLLAADDTAIRRMLLQLLRELDYAPEEIRPDFLDYCMTRINAECEPYAIRCFSLYCAAKMCISYPELVDELRERLDMLATQPLSPGLKSALSKVNKYIMNPKRSTFN